MVLLIPLDLSASGGDFCFSKTSALLCSFILLPTKPPIPKFFCSSGNLFHLKASFSSSCFLCKSKDIIRIRNNRKLIRTRRKVFLRKTVAMKEDTFHLTGERTRPLTSMIFFQGCQPNGRSRALLRNKRTNSFSPAVQIFRFLHAKTPASSFRAYRRLIWRPRRDSNARPFA